ncbi:staphyloferrin B biosynthesis protein SbnF [Staphylococcus coagulans]|uniref:staphyloferrin B biosynthesis protein SbnF n=1 Tax=Staphylococcus coagulans TaxID=74706 RepID=UPI002871D13B|nr:staphyloferrin B biosynthesis protein SbnF [Staphylococcus coagulans]MDR9833077.1 staphyloferrin B biosynthesis protein SbnF [Staphylococcus coagulans]
MDSIVQKVRTRIMNQLITSLIYEDVVQYDVASFKDYDRYTLKGTDVSYQVDIQASLSFGRLTVVSPVWLRHAEGQAETLDYVTLLRTVEFTFEKDEEKLEHFIIELLQTELKDIQAWRYRMKHPVEKLVTYDDYEAYTMDGHMYHPSYKSRLGFSLKDNATYGPDFRPAFQLHWVAVDKHNIEETISQSIEVSQLLQAQLGSDTYTQFVETIQSHGKDVDDVAILPVHPWQFERVIEVEFAEAKWQGELLYLGMSEEKYTPQQSIRTLTPQQPERYYLKVPMSLTNTSTKRILAPHTIENAAQITDWIKKIQAHDVYLAETLKTVFLGEVLGQAYLNKQATETKQAHVYGALGVIWRENIHNYLEPKESAIPFNALYVLDTQQQPLIQTWIAQYGLEAWLEQFFKVAIEPMIHMLYYHGIAFESHAQNMMLIHEDGWPTRIALKDFHDGIRFKRALLSDIAQDPKLKEMPESHKKINSNSFIETEDEALVRDFLHDAFFFINIAEIVRFINAQYQLEERKQWEMIAQVIKTYQNHFPNLQNYAHFDLFEPTIQVEKLTTRRLRDDSEMRIHHVNNPLGGV